MDLVEWVKRWLGERFFATGWFISESQFRELQDKNLLGVPVVLVMEHDGQVSVTPITAPRPQLNHSRGTCPVCGGQSITIS